MGKIKLGKCPLCNNINGTLAHIVNFCPTALLQGRFTWRHNSVLNYLTSEAIVNSTSNIAIYANIPGYSINGTTIPADVLVTNGEGSKPDLVLLNRTDKKIAVMELTCPLPQNVVKAHDKKTLKYTQMKIDLIDKGYKTSLVPFEVISNGHIK